MQVDRSSTQSILKTGSFTGIRFPEELGSDYLSAEAFRPQSLCSNIEGWGPISPDRYDFTPCFMDVTVAAVAGFGIVFGAGALWWLLNRKKAQEVPRNWHFWTKLVWLSILGANSLYADPFVLSRSQ